MRDISVFDTQWGVGSLILNQIPYTGIAYIRIHSSQNAAEFLEECIAFCRACGAEHIYATGHPACEMYPLHTHILRMQIKRESLAKMDAFLVAVTEETVMRWREIYNDKVKTVPNGVWMTQENCTEMLQKGDGYYIYHGDKLLGIGRAMDDQIEWVASLCKGAGQTVVKALAGALCNQTLYLEVASANEKAMRLYNAMGFVQSQVISSWYTVFEK